MRDLWPNLLDDEFVENNSERILKEQARALGSKMQNKVKATFSKLNYKPNVSDIARQSHEIITSRKEIEDDLAEKIDINEKLKSTLYKFEIYNVQYRFRLFKYEYSELYPNTIIIDENIAHELNMEMINEVENDKMLEELLVDIFSTLHVRQIIHLMMSYKANQEVVE